VVVVRRQQCWWKVVMALAGAFLVQKLIAALTPESELNDPRIWLEEVGA
jgi:hypothetical protein